MGQTFQAQIQYLTREGIATHVIKDQQDIDSIFAMSRAREMPEVRFAATFEDGSLLLGCPDGLPAQLDGLAAPVDPVLDGDAADDLGQDVPPDAKITQLADRIAEQMPQSGGLDLDALQTAIAEALATGLSAMAPAPVGDGLAQQLEALTGALTQPPPATDESAVLDAIADLKASIAAQDSPDTEDGPAGLTSAVDHFGAAATQLATVIATLSATADGAPADGAVTQIAPMLEKLTTTAGQLDQTLSNLAAAEIPDGAPSFGALLATMQDRVASVAEGQDALATSLRDGLSELSHLTAPTLDLTPQRQSFAIFATALSTALARFETIAARLEELAGGESVPGRSPDTNSVDQSAAPGDILADSISEDEAEPPIVDDPIQALEDQVTETLDALVGPETADDAPSEEPTPEPPSDDVSNAQGELPQDVSFDEAGGADEPEQTPFDPADDLDSEGAPAEDDAPAEMSVDATTDALEDSNSTNILPEPNTTGIEPSDAPQTTTDGPYTADPRMSLEEFRVRLAEVIATQIRDKGIPPAAISNTADPRDV